MMKLTLTPLLLIVLLGASSCVASEPDSGEDLGTVIGIDLGTT